MNKTSIALVLCFLMVGMAIYAGGTAEQPGQKSGDSASAAISKEGSLAPTKTVTDHAGNTVEIPAEPKRIASLHSMNTTVNLIELDAPLIGTATRTKLPEKKPYIRGTEELFGIKFENTGYFNYGQFGKDIEQIKISKPDLIVGTVRRGPARYKTLSAIAPTVLIDFDYFDKFKIYKDLATWLGKEKVFNEKYDKYTKRVAALKTKFVKQLANKTVVYIWPRAAKSQLTIAQYYGSALKVAYDLGLQKTEFVKQNYKIDELQSSISPEIIGEFENTDYVLSKYINMSGHNKATVYKDLDIVSPGWRNILKAYKNNTFMVLNGEMAYPASFVSLHYVLDEFEKHIK